MSKVQAWASQKQGEKLTPFSFEMASLGPEEVEVEIEHCGLCHSDLDLIGNVWGTMKYPVVAGHEIVGKIVALGEVAKTKGLALGQTVGVGWNKASCQHCNKCLEGANQLCVELQSTVVNNHGGFANRIKAHWLWTIPIPAGIDAADAGPLFCAGITVFSPLVDYAVSPTSRIGVFGVGGLGHLALQFYRAWGSEVTAFSSTKAKYAEIRALGAHHIASSKDSSEWKALKGTLDLIVVTTAVALDWDKIIAMLAPGGRLHILGLIYEPIPINVLSLLIPQKSVSSSPAGSRAAFGKMLRFAAQHKIAAKAEHFPMSRINEAIAHLESGKANYRVVLDADFRK